MICFGDNVYGIVLLDVRHFRRGVAPGNAATRDVHEKFPCIFAQLDGKPVGLLQLFIVYPWRHDDGWVICRCTNCSLKASLGTAKSVGLPKLSD